MNQAVTQTLAEPVRAERRGSRTPPKPQTLLQRGLTGACLVGALAALVPSTQMVFAGLASYRTDLTLQRWDAAGQPAEDGKWQAALNTAKQANALYPVANGSYLEQLARVYAWKDFEQPAGADGARESRQAAALAYRQSVAARPTWPNTWADLAQNKLALEEFDGEFTQALEQAEHWGPYRPAVQLELASIGLRAWPVLTHQQRVNAFTSARKAMESTNEAANSLFTLAQANGLEEALCISAGKELDSTRNYCTRGGNR